jgi:type IV pilus assembly protein PilB
MDRKDTESEIENIIAHRFNADKGETPNSILRKILLSQPDGITVPNVMNSETLDELAKQAVSQRRSILTRVQAKSAADALLQLYNLAGNKKQFVSAVTCVTGQRLARRLCDACKQPIQVQPKMIQQLGGDPSQQSVIYQPFKMPPPEQRLDKKGKPIEIPPCATCAAIGYIGRIAIFETIIVNDQIRSALLQNSSAGTIGKLAVKSGNKPMLAGGYQLVLLGITTLAEVQRVLKD